jgi:DNA-binding CsgD family transcriptional regulator
MSGKRIAAQMEISANTVNDHLTSIYRKAGVRGKDELVAHLCGTAVN